MTTTTKNGEASWELYEGHLPISIKRLGLGAPPVFADGSYWYRHPTGPVLRYGVGLAQDYRKKRVGLRQGDVVDTSGGDTSGSVNAGGDGTVGGSTDASGGDTTSGDGGVTAGDATGGDGTIRGGGVSNVNTSGGTDTTGTTTTTTTTSGGGGGGSTTTTTTGTTPKNWTVPILVGVGVLAVGGVAFALLYKPHPKHVRHAAAVAMETSRAYARKSKHLRKRAKELAAARRRAA